MITGTMTARSTRASQQPSSPWQLGTTPSNYVITNVRAVLPDRVTESSAVAVREGRIEEVILDDRGLRGDVDGAGLLLTAGLIDVHSDSLEKERQPRPTATLPWDFAMASFESKVVAAGVTTVFHGAGFHKNSSHGVDRNPEKALDLCRAVDEFPSQRVDHRVLHRFNIRADGTALIEQRLTELGAASRHLPIMLSHEDHTPGQGQYADINRFIESLVAAGEERDEATLRVHQRIADAQHTETLREANAQWMAQLAAHGSARLIGHDLDTVEAVDTFVERGGSVAEFPTTLEAAQRAREHGLIIIAGAPNVLRGGSHSGNIGAVDLIQRGLVDALASDYLSTGMLASVMVLIRQGVLPPHEAFGLVTSGPAVVADLRDRGMLAEGMRADLTLIDDSGAWPKAVATFSAQSEQASI